MFSLENSFQLFSKKIKKWRENNNKKVITNTAKVLFLKKVLMYYIHSKIRENVKKCEKIDDKTSIFQKILVFC